MWFCSVFVIIGIVAGDEVLQREVNGHQPLLEKHGERQNQLKISNRMNQKTREEQQKEIDEMTATIGEMKQRIDQLQRTGRLQQRQLEKKGWSNYKFTPRDCADVMAAGFKTSGVYTVYVGSLRRRIQVYCDMTTDGGGWTVFQRRKDGSVDFYRNWANYSSGFGEPAGEFWLGNDNLHSITAGKSYHLRIDLRDFPGNRRYAEYTDFKVASACEKYKLTFSVYCGNAGDSLRRHNGYKFSTYDQDNEGHNCAVVYKGAFWYCGCHDANLNGLYLRGPHKTYAIGVNWQHWKGDYYSLKFTEMKIRPSDS